MKIKSSFVAGIVFLLMINLASAGLLDYYGKISASADIEGPTFYASPEEKLLINKEPSTHATYEIIDGYAIVFWTEEELGGIDFNYILKADLYIRAKVNNTTPPKPLELIFGYSDTSNIMHEICSSTVYISTEELSNYNAYCDGSAILEDVNEFYYKVQGGADESILYSINTKDTRVEVDKV